MKVIHLFTNMGQPPFAMFYSLSQHSLWQYIRSFKKFVIYSSTLWMEIIFFVFCMKNKIQKSYTVFAIDFKVVCFYYTGLGYTGGGEITSVHSQNKRTLVMAQALCSGHNTRHSLWPHGAYSLLWLASPYEGMISRQEVSCGEWETKFHHENEDTREGGPRGDRKRSKDQMI